MNPWTSLSNLLGWCLLVLVILAILLLVAGVIVAVVQAAKKGAQRRRVLRAEPLSEPIRLVNSRTATTRDTPSQSVNTEDA